MAGVGEAAIVQNLLFSPVSVTMPKINKFLFPCVIEFTINHSSNIFSDIIVSLFY